jgi:predicted aconitase
MILSDYEKSLLDGKEGIGYQRAMEMNVRYGDALGAERFIEVASVGGYLVDNGSGVRLEGNASFDEILSHKYLDSDEVVKIPHVKVPSFQVETCMDAKYYTEQGYTSFERDRYLANIKYLSQIGVELLCTCTPYLVGKVPLLGQHVAWMESSAVIFINSVLGARTNCEGAESALPAMLTGRTPYWGYHVPENRLGTHLINVEYEVNDMKEWGLLGYFAGKVTGERVPVMNGVSYVSDIDWLKNFGAAAASSGGVELYHIPGVTPEMQSVDMAFGGRRPEAVVTYGKKERQQTLDMINSTAKKSDVDFVMIGCPHCSIDQLWELASLLDGKKVSNKVDMWIFTSQSVKSVSDRNGFTKTIEDAGAKIMTDTCTALGQFKPKGATTMVTNAAKQAHYLPNFFKDLGAWYGTVNDCVNAAVSGKWTGE